MKTNDKKNNKFKTVCFIVLFLISLVVCLFFASKTLEREKMEPIIYTYSENVDFKVYLNDNEFYEQDYLDMNKAYIASLIKYIDINFNYLFNIKENSKIDFDYKILGELIIQNNGGNRKYFEKTYTLLDTQNKKIDNNKSLNINENIKIDYGYYNKLANSFRSTYGVDTSSYLNVYLEVKAKSDDKLNYKINENNKLLLTIPLSERAIEIALNAKNKEVTKQIIPTGNVIFNSKYLVLEIIFFIITSILFIICIRNIFSIVKKPCLYDKYVRKLLREYDRLIVETHTKLNMDKYNIIEVKNFTELLDVRDNLKVPILYYNIVKHEKGIFYIKDNNDIYLLTVSDDELINNNNK